MKTIFFLLPTGITVRNFLFTGVLDRLLARDDLRVIAFTRMPDVFERYPVQSERFLFERLPDRRWYSVTNFLHAVLRRRFYRTYETASLKILLKGPLSQRISELLLENLLSQPLPRSKTIYRWLCTVEERLSGVSPPIQQFFSRYKPSIVVSTHPTAMDEYDFLRYARKTGVTSVGIVKSWDVLTTKGYIPVPPDYYLVWNQIMKEEITLLYRVPGDRVWITGIPQFDLYADTASAPPREEFFRKLNLDPAKKTILYATSPPWINREDPEILRQLAMTFGQDRRISAQILARLHPIDYPERYSGIACPNLAFQIPGAQAGKNPDARVSDPGFITGLRDTLFHSDVVVNTCSTTSLDAVAMDRPVVNIAFDLEPKTYYKSCRRYYDFDHYQPIIKSGATKIAASFEELVSLIRCYMDNPELESLERARLRETMCYKVDGQSGQRVAEYLLRRLDGLPYPTIGEIQAATDASNEPKHVGIDEMVRQQKRLNMCLCTFWLCY